MTKSQIKRRLKKIISPFFRSRLIRTDFSIISNNCWAGAIYDHYGIQYKSPTIGSWIPPKDYIKFLFNLKYYLSLDLVQIEYSQSVYKDLLIKQYHKNSYRKLEEYVIAKLGDIEIMFLHYKTFEEAKLKWNRRKERINFDNLIVKFNDQNEFIDENLKQFVELPYKQKVFYTCNKNYLNLPFTVFIDEKGMNSEVSDDTIHLNKYLNLNKLFNNGVVEAKRC